MATKQAIPLVGIIFDYNSNWMGGTYYILNLLHAIAGLPKEEQPTVIIYGETTEGFELVKKEVKLDNVTYKKISTIFENKMIVGVNYLYRSVTGANLFKKGPRSKNEVIFPNARGAFFEHAKHKIFWVPDFQEKYYPSFFSEGDLTFRETFNKNLVASNAPVVFSSIDAKNDFTTHYPLATNPIYTLPFAVTIPDYAAINFEDIKMQYQLDIPFFITPNQFWIHKNHSVVIDAATILRDKGIKCKVLFSGKNYDPRCPEYTDQLIEKVRKNNLEKEVLFLGFLDRAVLLSLIKNATAVIQPSLFEGWSTVVEDAKAIGKPVIASSLAVHKEQMADKGIYFDPTDAVALADAMLRQINSGIENIEWDYAERRNEFARGFMRMINQVAE